MSDDLNIRQVISSSTSDVALSDLAKKGFKKVKVLNKDMVHRLVEEAVNKVVRTRVDEVSEHDKEKYYKEAKSEFDRLAREQQTESDCSTKKFEERLKALEGHALTLSADIKDRNEQIQLLQSKARSLQQSLENRETRLRELEAENIKNLEAKTALQDELDSRVKDLQGVSESKLQMDQERADLGQRLLALEQENSELKNAPAAEEVDLSSVVKQAISEMQDSQATQASGGSEIDGLKDSINALAQQIQKGGGGGNSGASSGPIVDSADVIEGLFASVGDDADVNSNLNSDSAVKAKAGGVSDSLNKLKSLKKGGSGK